MKKKNKHIRDAGISIVLSATVAFSSNSFHNMEGTLARAATFEDSRVLYLSFEKNLKDSSGKGNDGTAVDTIHYANGIKGQCLDLTGQGYIDLGTSDSLQPSELTLSFWLKASSEMAGEHLIMWNKDNGSWYSDGFYLGSTDDRPLELSAGSSAEANGQPLKAFVSGNRKEFFPEGEWVHIVLTYSSDKKQANVYRNGVKQEVSMEFETEDGKITGTKAKKWLGTNSPAYGSKSIFSIDEYELFSSVASEQDALALYTKNGGKIDYNSMIEEDYNALDIAKEISSNISLPTEGTKGGSNITWSSSNPEVISETGLVTRPSSETGNINVRLTARLTNNTEIRTKEFEVIVKAVNDFANMNHFNMEDVIVTDDYEMNAFQKDVEYLISLDKDRLLAGFRETAAYAAGYSDNKVKEYMKNATRYGGGWENSLIGGHTMGHYLTALAQAYANPAIKEEDKKKVENILNELVNSLKACQDMTTGSKICQEGYIFGAVLKSDFMENLEKQFDNVEQGKANIGTQAWVPWYTMHKILAGLVDVYKQTGNKTSLEVASKLGDWVYHRVSKWDQATQNHVLNIEYGGMNDCLYELYKITKKESHAEAAHKFDETALFEKIKAGTSNVLNGKHANTTIPKVLGALNRYQALGEKESEYLEYAESFWDMVIDRHTYITGGNSEDEHFGADFVLNNERTNCNNETCNTYNMLKLSRELFKITGEKKYADYYENTLRNAIMASQNPETGLMMYFQPMATGYQKVFSTAEESFWCCTGSGMENFTKLNDSIYFYKDNTVVVNQYISSELTWEKQNLKLIQETDFLNSDTAIFTVDTISGEQLKEATAIRFRIPDWAANDVVVSLDGKETIYSRDTTEYAVISADNVKKGTRIAITIPKTVMAYNLPDSENTYAFKYGPYVLSAKLGTQNQTTGSHGVSVRVPTKKAVENDNISIQNANADTVKDYMEHIAEYMVKTDNNMEFTLKDTDCNYSFVPHYSQYKENYGIYWTFSIDKEGKTGEQILETKRKARFESAKQGEIEAGYGQYENGLKEENSVGDSARLTRYAKAGGYFQYEIAVKPEVDNYLLVTFSKEDNGKPMKISIGGTEIFNQTVESTRNAINETLSEEDQKNFYQIRIKITKDVIEANAKAGSVDNTKKVVDVRFEGTASLDSARVCSWLYSRTGYAEENSLKSLNVKEGTIKKSSDGKRYTVTVPKTTKTVHAEFIIEDTRGYLVLDDNIVDETAEQVIELAAGNTSTTRTIQVFAEDFTTAKEYTLVITTAKTKKVKLNKTRLALKAGDTAKLKVKNSSKKAIWSVNKKKIAKVNKNGLVTAIKAGKCKITAKIGNKKLVCQVVVARSKK